VELYSATTTGLQNLTHQNAYTWQLNGVNTQVGNATITSAVLTFFNFANWVSAAQDPTNILWVDLLDTSTHKGDGQIASAIDNTNGGTLGINDVLDGFRYSGGNNVSVIPSLVPAGPTSEAARIRTTRAFKATTRRAPLTRWAAMPAPSARPRRPGR
jgi:hypothetical protein